MSGSEVMTILILFHFSSFRDLKHFYLFVRSRMKSDFPHTVSYNRFVELERKVCIQLAVFLKMKALGQCTGISFIDSTPIRSCHIKREKQHISSGVTKTCLVGMVADGVEPSGMIVIF